MQALDPVEITSMTLSPLAAHLIRGNSTDGRCRVRGRLIGAGGSDNGEGEIVRVRVSVRVGVTIQGRIRVLC